VRGWRGGGAVTALAPASLTPFPPLTASAHPAPAGAPWSAAQRRAHFRRPGASGGLAVGPGAVYTLHFWAAHVDFAGWRLAFFPWLDLRALLSGSPVQLALREMSTGQHAMCVEVWHRRLRGAPNSSALADEATAAVEGEWEEEEEQEQEAAAGAA